MIIECRRNLSGTCEERRSHGNFTGSSQPAPHATDMTNWRIRLRPLAVVCGAACVAGLALSGCGVGDPAAVTDPEQTDGSDEQQSPLSEFLGDGAGFATGERMVRSSSAGDLTDEQ